MGIKDYKAPRAEVIEVNVQGVLCQSITGGTPSNNPWTPGSDSAYGFGDDEDD